MPPRVPSSIVTASAMWPSREAGFQVMLAASRSCSQVASASVMACEGGQVKPRGMLLPWALALRVVCEGLVDLAAGVAGFADTSPAAIMAATRPMAIRRPNMTALTIAARAFPKREEAGLSSRDGQADQANPQGQVDQ